ncbi:hypothetical protein BCR42DRAFT_426465 [Absidia repens]|uniref:F-box domain-containing protein n=1 Tax=Absidia repens TaxID=90262 RepID=A0A1X2I171_9FUNG|nr:hypothetical protein BCR42DRAFT_426465 [Absidia repens]
MAQRFLDGLIEATRSSSSSMVGHFIQHIQLAGPFWTDTTLLVLLKHVPRLTCLAIGCKTGITDTSIQHLGRHCPHLTGLSLDRVPVTQLAMDAIGQQCRHLRQLSLASCHALGSHTFAALVHCPLQDVTLRSPSPWMMTHVGIKDVMQGIHGVTHLALPGSHTAFIEQLLLLLSSSSPATTNNHHHHQQLLLPHLESLTISHYQGKPMTPGDPAALIPFLQTHGSGRLKELGLCFGVFSDSTVDALVAALLLESQQKLGILVLRWDGTRSVSVHAIRRLIQQCPRLRYMSLAMCSIKAFEFPEASPKCMTNTTFGYPDIGDVYHVDHLDEEAITKIRLNF